MVTTCLKQKHPRRIAAYFLFGRNTIFFMPANATCWGGTYSLVFSDSWTQYRHWTIQIYGLNFKCLASTCCPHAASFHGTLCGLLFCVVRRSSDFVEKDVWKEQFLFHCRSVNATTAGNACSLSFKLNPKYPSKKISIPCLTIYNGNRSSVKVNAVLLWWMKPFNLVFPTQLLNYDHNNQQLWYTVYKAIAGSNLKVHESKLSSMRFLLEFWNLKVTFYS